MALQQEQRRWRRRPTSPPSACLPACLPSFVPFASLSFRSPPLPSRHRQAGWRSSSRRRHGMPNSLTSHVACIVHPSSFHLHPACTRLPVANAPIAARTNVTTTNTQIPSLPRFLHHQTRLALHEVQQVTCFPIGVQEYRRRSSRRVLSSI